MEQELNRPSLITCFKQGLPKMAFITEIHRKTILQKLDDLYSEKTRYQKAKIAGELWKLIFSDSMAAITPNKRGIPELFAYIDEFLEYEDVLFAVDSHYRDHIIHSIWVMLVGFYLIQNFDLYKQIKFSGVIDDIGGTEQSEKCYNKVHGKLNQFQLPIWFLIALTHDLGYPIQKTKAGNLRMAKMLKNYGFLGLQEFQYSFTVVNQPAIDILLDSLASAIGCCAKGEYRLVKSQGLRLDAAKTFENTDHGIMSAYLLQNKIDWITEGLALSEVEFLPVMRPDVAFNHAVILQIFDAITSHTNVNRYYRNLNSMSVLLLLCDEMEEFSRYRQSTITHEWFEAQIRTEVKIEKTKIRITYTFQDLIRSAELETNLIGFFDGKANIMKQRFELSTGELDEIILICKDSTKPNKPECSFVWKSGAEPIRKYPN